LYSLASDRGFIFPKKLPNFGKTRGSVFDLDPVWSPDGTKIAFEKGDGNQYEVYVVNADGSGLTNLTNTN
jgi:Tol biopolymer transport system component